MGGHVINLFVIIAFGVIIADLVANGSGTTGLLNGMSNFWKIGVNGMLGKPS